MRSTVAATSLALHVKKSNLSQHQLAQTLEIYTAERRRRGGRKTANSATVFIANWLSLSTLFWWFVGLRQNCFSHLLFFQLLVPLETNDKMVVKGWCLWLLVQYWTTLGKKCSPTTSYFFIFFTRGKYTTPSINFFAHYYFFFLGGNCNATQVNYTKNLQSKALI